MVPCTARLAAFSERPHNPSTFERSLPAIALGIGVAWVVSLGLGLGVMEGGDTPGFLTAAARISQEGLSFRSLFGSAKGGILYHVTHFWLYLWGKMGFVAFVAILTALIPYSAVMLLRRAGVRPVFVGGALLYLAVNEEIYKWAFYVLSDGLLISLVAIVLMLVTVPKIRRHLWWLIPVVWYNMYFSRPTAFIMIPALVVYTLIIRDLSKRFLIIGVLAATLLFYWGVSALQARGEAERADVREERSLIDTLVHVENTRRDFVIGALLMDEKMSEKLAVPFTKEEAEGRSLYNLCRSYKTYCARYTFRRYFAYLLPIYPLYSLRHKVFNGLFYGSSLLLSAAGFVLLIAGVLRFGRGRLREVSRDKTGAWVLCGLLILFASLMHLRQAVDPDARYLMPWVVPWICFNFIQADMALGLWGRKAEPG